MRQPQSIPSYMNCNQTQFSILIQDEKNCEEDYPWLKFFDEDLVPTFEKADYLLNKQHFSYIFKEQK